MEILLQTGEMLVLKGDRQGLMVQCGAGLLWITQAGDSRDHLLKRGRHFTSSLPGRIIVTALADSRLTAVETPAIHQNAYALPSGIFR